MSPYALHMGGAPPRTTLTLASHPLPGRRFSVRWKPAWAGSPGPRAAATPLAWASRFGDRAVLTLLGQHGRGKPYDFATLDAESWAPCLALTIADAVAERLADFGIPQRFGVFADSDPPRRGDRRVDDGAALAILLKRSGPLFVPGRAPDFSLVVPCVTTLIFPEEHEEAP